MSYNWLHPVYQSTAPFTDCHYYHSRDGCSLKGALTGAVLWRDTQLLRPHCKNIFWSLLAVIYVTPMAQQYISDILHHHALPLETTPCCSLSTRQHLSTHGMYIYCPWLARFPSLRSMCGISSCVNALSADLQDLGSYIRYNEMPHLVDMGP